MWGKLAQTGLHFIGDWTRTMAPGGAREDPIPPLKGVKKMRRLIVAAVNKFVVGNERGEKWFGLFVS